MTKRKLLAEMLDSLKRFLPNFGMNYRSQDYERWLKNYRVYSKTKSANLQVLLLYDYILEHQYVDGDHWHACGSNQIQQILNPFTKTDWNDLEKDIINWSIDDQLVLVKSVAFGFDGLSVIALQNSSIPYASDFLTSLFITLVDEDVRHEIVYFAFFIHRGDPKPLETLVKIKEWMLQHGYNTEPWLNSKINPLGHIEEAIKKASR